MKTKILYFKFTKKNLENHERNCKSKKNYENIFNNILNGDKLDKISDNKNNNIDNKKLPIKKNKIKCISKINDIGNQESINANGAKRKEENKTENININKNENISFKPKKSLKTENNIKSKETNDLINEYDSKSNTEVTKNIKIDLLHPFTNSNKNEKEILNTNYYSVKENKKNIIDLSSKGKNKEKKAKNKMARKNNTTKLSQAKKEEEPNKTNIKVNKIKKKSKIIINNIKKYEPSQTEKDYVNMNKSNVKNKKLNPLKIKDDKYMKKDNYNKRLSLIEMGKLLQNKNVKKNSQFNFVHKITITNDNLNDNKNENSKTNNNKKSFNYTLNNDSKSKKLILNNTNSNINININITNINDKNIQKENDFKLNNNSKNNTDIVNNNNFNNNITTVNIINNNNNKKKVNDYKLLFYNHSKKEKYSSYLNKISSKGIEIQSININLGEETNDEYNKNKLKKNLTITNKQNNTNANNNFYKKKDIENENKQAQSEYERFRDLEDFWSNRSQTSFSCKSGFTASRKLRSLSRERDKIKMLNKCKNKNNDMERISDKLLTIVNNFHNNSSFYNLKRNKKTIKGIRKKYKKNGVEDYNTISFNEKKIFKKKKFN